MAYTTIDKPSDYFNTKLYTGNLTNNTAITGLGFQPDLVWIKSRTNTENHNLFDAVRGTPNFISTGTTNAEDTDPANLQSFDSDGFTLGTRASINGSGTNFVSWNWKANGAGSSNTDGDITSTVSVNTTSGFSITTYTATGTAGDTVGTGMSSGIDLYFIKRRDVAQSIPVMTSLSNMGAGKYLYLNTTDAVAGSSIAFDNEVAPTSSGVITLGTNATVNASGGTYVCYAFKSIKGFSKIGSYTGNASATDNAFIYCGFKPAFVITKCSSIAGDRWTLYDNKRDPYNYVYKRLFPDGNIAESLNTDADIDFLSNGFKIRTDAGTSGASQTYIYMAFAEHPLVSSSGVPCTAR